MNKDLKKWDEIVAKARRLDEGALAMLTKEYYPVIYRYLYYRVRTKEDAEDLTGDVFVRVVGAIKQQKGNFLAWLFQITKNLLTDYYRKKGKRQEVSFEHIEIPMENGTADTRRAVTVQEMQYMLSRLTEEQGAVITFRFIEGLTNEETARIMNKSVGAVKLLQFRALAALRDLMKREQE